MSVEHLPTKTKFLRSNPSTAKKFKNGDIHTFPVDLFAEILQEMV
jgi:hypothetical protein